MIAAQMSNEKVTPNTIPLIAEGFIPRMFKLFTIYRFIGNVIVICSKCGNNSDNLNIEQIFV